MNRILCGALVTMSLFACGPGSMAVVDEGDGEADVETYDAELTSTNKSMTWFPMQAGNSWTFKASNGETKTITMTNVADHMALVTGLRAEPTWVGLASDTGTTLYQWKNDAWEPLVKFGYAVTSWKTNSMTCNGLVGKRTATGNSFTTPAGTFADTRTIGFAQITSPTARCAAPDLNELTFAPNIGVVTIKDMSNTRFNLVSATIDGKRFPLTTPSSDLDTKVVLDRVSYTSYPNTIQCITTPCPGNAVTAEAQIEFQLKNLGSTSRTWQFSTGCQFDVELVSMTGRVVRRLSEGRACTFSLTSLTLGAGQSKVYSTKLPLADSTGLQLSGTYTVRAKLIPSGDASNAPVATSSLDVTVLLP